MWLINVVNNFLKYTIEQFDSLATPHNCEFWIIEKNERGKYQLISELKNEEGNLNQYWLVKI